MRLTTESPAENPPQTACRAGPWTAIRISFALQAPGAIPQFHNSRKICTIGGIGRGMANMRAREGYSVIKQDIVHQVIERTGLPRTKAEAAVDMVFEGLKQALAAGERIELRGFGVFSVRARKTGIGRNPRTGTEVSIAPGKAVRFKPGKELHSLEEGSGAAARA